MVRLGGGCRRAGRSAARGVAKPRAASRVASRQRLERRSRAAARKRSVSRGAAARALRVAGCSRRRAQAEHRAGASLSHPALLCHGGADAAPPPGRQASAAYAQRAAPPLRTGSPSVGRASAPVSGAVPRPSSALAGAFRSSAAAPRASASPSPLRRLATELRVRCCFCFCSLSFQWLTPCFSARSRPSLRRLHARRRPCARRCRRWPPRRGREAQARRR